ncbi:alpha/beta hydrolase [Microtetraspora niveoalba]|uniref:alpha/beta hydrolase n=1 Tax=Microtetraspora niveoalba TaxID=46175 RepID=UPI00082A5D25|nr:alpha/beta hydrolase [Microtetraspora niveoalba]
MPLHPDARRIIDRTRVEDPGQVTQFDAPAMREAFRQTWAMPDELPAVGGVVDSVVPGPAGDIPVRIYTPEGDGPFPAFVWFHGGGWTIGSVEENEYSNRLICAGADVVVVSVDYRLAPENPFPAAADDCYAVVEWVARNGAEISADGARIAVGGESAGGNLAAVVSLKARDLGGPAIALQLLVSPVLGHPADGRASYEEFSDGYFLSRESMEWFFTTYPRDERDLEDPYLLPLRAGDLSRLPRALILEAEYDVLRDEGEEYAKRLAEAGGEVDHVCYDGLIHGFFGLLGTELEPSKHAHDRAVAALRAACHGAS